MKSIEIFAETPILADAGSWCERLAFIRWVRSAGRLKPETDRELAGALGVGLPWLGKWKSSLKAPPGRTEEATIRAALGEEVTRWLYEGTGAVPHPAAWTIWEAAAGAAPGDQMVVVSAEASEQLSPPDSIPSGARAVAGRRGRSGRAP